MKVDSSNFKRFNERLRLAAQFARHGTPVARWEMAGTEGTYKYRVLVCGVLGRAAVRDIGPLGYRVRIEPTSESAARLLAPYFTREDGWKQPGDGGEDRFSRVYTFEEWPSYAQMYDMMRKRLSLLVWRARSR